MRVPETAASVKLRRKKLSSVIVSVAVRAPCPSGLKVIVGVTLAFMGLVYYLMPRMGFGRPQGRLATLQPTLYGAGQLLHIAGLLWSGGYGVQRKVAGGDQLLRTTEQVAGMGLMGLGGLLAVAGGILFAIVVLRCLWISSTSRS